ncbi:TraA family conjugative transfer protein [Ottowia sp.]|uniref:TraA family conjugative transfer protein n=1 Tax=Ottowia sp. TaxID=1898956 RepID=UPI0025EBF2C0|nr:TraA family conjugative transfer protein [Ottowia sp.]MBK6616528.1 hypothetical protein [Ottowia sp.]
MEELMTTGLKDALDFRDARAKTLTSVGKGLLAVAVAVGLAWLVLYLFASGAAPDTQVITSIDLPAAVRGHLPMTGGAGAGGRDEVAALVSTITMWTNGYLGKIIALGAFMMGTAMGIAKQSVVPAVMGIVWALMMAMGPQVVGGLLPQQAGAQAGESIVSKFEHDKDLGTLRSSIDRADLSTGAKGYLVAQAILMLPPAERAKANEELLSRARSVVTAAATGELHGADVQRRLLVERSAFGQGMSPDTRDREVAAKGFQRLAGASWLWGSALALLAAAGGLIIAVAVTIRNKVHSVRNVMTMVPETASTGNGVPDFSNHGSADIEQMIRMMEQKQA